MSEQMIDEKIAELQAEIKRLKAKVRRLKAEKRRVRKYISLGYYPDGEPVYDGEGVA